MPADPLIDLFALGLITLFAGLATLLGLRTRHLPTDAQIERVEDGLAPRDLTSILPGLGEGGDMNPRGAYVPRELESLLISKVVEESETLGMGALFHPQPRAQTTDASWRLRWIITSLVILLGFIFLLSSWLIPHF